MFIHVCFPRETVKRKKENKFCNDFCDLTHSHTMTPYDALGKQAF